MKKRILITALSAALLCSAMTLPAKAADPITYTDVEATGKAMTAQLRARETLVTVDFTLTNASTDDVNALASAIYSRALAHTMNPVEGDYLYMHILQMDAPFQWQTQGDTSTGSFHYQMTYAANTAQENETTAAVNAVMAELNLNGKSDYEKAKAIYDYICDNVTYDYDNHTLSHSAYAAVVNKNAVCQGYAALFYRMALTAGLDARCITGRSHNENHGWNIVKVDGKWYNIDSTWGARANRGSYFLKGSDNFPDHTRDDAYAAPSFTASYPMSDTDYAASEAPAPAPAPAPSGFTDVEPGSFYAEAVAWAVENGITSGTSETTFEPYAPCTRGHVVTFLYRAAKGTRAATGSAFTDVVPGSYYSDAVDWAVANGVTNGTSETTFEPESICTRGQVVTLLHKALGTPEASASRSFSDVAPGAYYEKPVQWAVANGVTNGTSETTFEPMSPCNRGHVVTFLYRAYHNR